jgi:class 3 adenylate cyclase/tetratricopeptide (TPR) repeat protein
MKCPQCEQENPHGARFCKVCGARLELRCASCGHGNAPGSRFCNQCGQAIGEAGPAEAASRFGSPETYTPQHLAEKILVSKSALEGERKQVTVLFCDIAGSTALAQRLGPEAMHTLLSRFFELALGEVHRYEGTINQFLGDGFMALFGAPIAYEDHARRAVLAASAIQRRLKEQRATIAPGPGDELTVRMGLNTGAVVVGKIGDNLRMDYTAVGDTTHLAFRLQQLAEPGAILISEATFRFVRGFVRSETIELLAVKGKTEPVTAYRLVGLAPRRSSLEAVGERPFSRFVGRERELAALDDLLKQAEAGQGQVVGIVGEPGVGKSRLLYEFQRRLAGKRLTYLEARCLSYGSTIPYLPVLDHLRSSCGIADLDPSEVVAEKIRLGLQEVGTDAQAVACLLHLLGVKVDPDPLAVLTPEAIKARTFEFLRQMALHGSRQRPLIFVVEDLHWIDKTSEEYFTSFVESLAGAPILLVTTYRPGYRPPWIEKSYATQLALRPLSNRESLAVIQSVVARNPISDHVAQRILDKAEGNPFFLEELARAVSEHGDIAIPETVEAVLMARIDRLPNESKRLLQTAAVLGREVSRGLLEAVWEGSTGLEPHLSELKRLEFLYEATGTPETTYVFKHALTQEVAYEALLTPQRQALHAAAGRALEALYADWMEETYDRLAYHYARTEEIDKAIEYLTRFARRAAQGHSHAEAAAALREALARAERLPAERRDRLVLELALRQVQSLNFLGRNQESLELLLAQGERLQRLQDTAQNCRYHFSLGLTYNFLGNRDRSAENVQRALEEAERCGDERTMGRACALLTLESYWSGRPREGIERGRRAVALLERTRQPYWLAQTHFYMAINYYLMGALRPALEAATRAEAVGEAIGDASVRSYAASTLGGIHAAAGDFEAGIAACRRGLELAADPLSRAQALGFWGYAYLEREDAAHAIPLLQEAAEQMGLFWYRQLQGWFTALLGECCLLAGQPEKARDLIGRGLEITREVKYGLGVGWAQRALGRLTRTAADVTEAKTHFTDALATFGSVEARFEVGRTHLALAELGTTTGDPGMAATHLRAAHRLFVDLVVPTWVARTEGLATAAGVCLPI